VAKQAAGTDTEIKSTLGEEIFTHCIKNPALAPGLLRHVFERLREPASRGADQTKQARS
jgi:hypothetical protein